MVEGDRISGFTFPKTIQYGSDLLVLDQKDYFLTLSSYRKGCVNNSKSFIIGSNNN